MYAITTKYLGPTDTRGARIQARYGDIRQAIPYPYELDSADAHRAAAEALVASGKLPTYTAGRRLVQASLVDSDVFVLAPHCPDCYDR